MEAVNETHVWSQGALATALSMAMLGSPIFAETFPSKPIKVISPYSGGGNSELFVRLVADEVGRTIGQRVFVEPRPGALAATLPRRPSCAPLRMATQY